MTTIKTTTTAREFLHSDYFNSRSAWSRGVAEYAEEILDTVEVDGIALASYENFDALKAAALNGASGWSQASWGGSYLCYDADIAERLCSPSELKKTRNGDRRPNAREEWLDVQARALNQAFYRVVAAWRHVKMEVTENA